jgi:two-component system sensor histidine kinase DegS
LTVEDDGRGFDNDALLQAPAGNGLGLLDIRERAALLNGCVTLESRQGSGTTVHVYIPLREENHAEDSRPDR